MPDRSDTKQDVKLNPPQVFLETARGFNGAQVSANQKRLTDENAYDVSGAVALSLSSIGILYSVLAVESFINHELYDLWRKSRQYHGKRPEGPAPNSRSTLAHRLHAFYEKYGVEDNFERLKCRNEIRELGERIKTVCKYRGIQSIREADPELWQRFLLLLKDSRHFLTHFYPDPRIVQERFTQILTRDRLGDYPAIASSMIRHFYIQNGSVPPAWLNENKLFRFKGIEFPL